MRHRNAIAPQTVTLSNATGIEVALVDRGAAIQSIRVPVGRRIVDAVLGYEDPERYHADPFFLGATVGRYAGRIGNGSFLLQGRRIEVNRDADGHCLHGGPGGLHSRAWRLRESNGESAVFSYLSDDGDEGFPGALDLTVRYSLQGMALIIELTAMSTADTVLSLSNHAYFNLAGGGTIGDHVVSVNADAYTPVNGEAIPTGEIRPVAGSAFDLREESSLRKRVGDGRCGYDQNFALNKGGERSVAVNGQATEFAASAYCEATDVRLNVFTTHPGLQFYTGQYLGEPFVPYQGLCFEAQAFPDAPNRPEFPSALLRAGERYLELIVYEFEAGTAPGQAQEPVP